MRARDCELSKDTQLAASFACVCKRERERAERGGVSYSPRGGKRGGGGDCVCSAADKVMVSARATWNAAH